MASAFRGSWILGVWLALFALAANGVEQNALSGSVLWAAVTEAAPQVGPTSADAASPPAFQHVDDGEKQLSDAMPADCPMLKGIGHTHRGHADCALCGPLGALAIFTPIFALIPIGPCTFRQAEHVRPILCGAAGLTVCPYRSRAPPVVV